MQAKKPEESGSAKTLSRLEVLALRPYRHKHKTSNTDPEMRATLRKAQGFLV
jgi:hypothetical protein